MKAISLFFISVIFLCGLNKTSISQKEFSYKSKKSEPRYLSKFKKVNYSFPEDLSASIEDIDTKAEEIITILNKTGNLAQQLDWFPKIEKENIYVSVTDLGNYRLSLIMEKGEYTIEKGFHGEIPSMVLKLTTQNIKNLHEILIDGKVTYEEKYRIYYMVAAPALRAIYYNGPNYRPGDKSAFKFDNFVQICIPPKEKVVLNGRPITIELTAVNVDGQWLVMRGLRGDPDIKLKLTLDDATELYRIGYYEVSKLKTPKDAKALSDEFLLLLNKTLEKTREDHQ